ncbi:GNAT family N-acetyltransferase [Cognatilysobacter terrigena]|uniref:GNAT family N-acetyltransferase n=1 Tax=Cognatilysobacter terrigena TaxID=2488749 RepID=UPI0010622B2B|nr:GNAT family N-acetyltransferase [Lysobacter terrigena]
MDVRTGQLDHPAVIALLGAHLAALAKLSPAESMHALDIDRLKSPDVTFWTAWDDDSVAGCAALKHLDTHHGELKSMRTAATHLRRGVASKLLDVVIDEARRRGYTRLSLETGTAAEFTPAHTLYRRAGFVACTPFADYVDDPNSTFMRLNLAPA